MTDPTKKAPGGRVSEAQRGVLDALTRLGFRVAVVRSVQDVEECLDHWLGDAGDAWQHVGSVAQSLVKRTEMCHENRAGPEARQRRPEP